jgi:hypothetical protein
MKLDRILRGIALMAVCFSTAACPELFAPEDSELEDEEESSSMNLTCPGSLPSGYQCLNNDGVVVPGKYDIPALHGTWVDTSFEVCMTLNSNGSSSFKYRFGSAVTNRKWGALVGKTGQLPSGPYYVFTNSNDPQIALLGYDSSRSLPFVGWGFKKATCPY